MKKFVAFVLVLLMSLSLVACGGEVDPKDAVIDTFNTTADSFDALANTINEDIDAYPQELIDTLNEMADALLEAKELLESDTEVNQEQADTLISQLNDIKAWTDDVYATLDDWTIEATTVDTSKEALIESFNYVSSRFDAVSAEINANIDAYDEEFIDGMISIAEGMIGYKEILESDVELTEDESLELLENLLLVDEWITSLEG